MYKRKIKQLHAELFLKKTKENVVLRQHTEVEICVEKIKADLPEGLSKLQVIFKNDGTVCVRSEKNGTAEAKKVCVYRFAHNARMIETYKFIFFSYLVYGGK